MPSWLSSPMSGDEPGSYVCTVYPADGFDAERARTLGGVQPRRWFSKRWEWEFRAANDEELARLLSALRDMGVAFLAAGPGWPAGDIFENMREHGRVSGPYRGIWWYGPGQRDTGEVTDH